MFDAMKVKDQCVQWIRDWFEQNGKGCNAVLGISGGKDSSVCAALCVEALGKDRVIGVTMPNGVQPDIEDSNRLIQHLGIRHYCVNIGSSFEALMKEVEARLGYEASAQTRINMAPRLRMTALYAVSQSNNGRVVNTCNLSEDWETWWRRPPRMASRAKRTRTTWALPTPCWTNTSVRASVKTRKRRPG